MNEENEKELAEIKASFAFANFDEQFLHRFAHDILYERKIYRRWRKKRLSYIQPYIDAGIIDWETLEGLSFNQVRVVIWQMRRTLPNWQRVLWPVKIPKPLSPEDDFAFERYCFPHEDEYNEPE